MSVKTPRLALSVRSGQGDYPVASFDARTELAPLIGSLADPFIIVDERVAKLYGALLASLPKERIYALPATEEEKTLAGVERAGVFLQRGGASKRSQLVLIGGGIVQDIGMFLAHTYYRGIPAYYVPTTLLSMSDSCIGAKCVLNLGEFKNQLGFFQAPKTVHIWSGFLQTLDFDDVRSGFGEIVKLAVTDSPENYELFERRIGENGFDLSWADEAIFMTLETKRRVIEADEYEANLRKTLNYGHTFGHALESITHHEVPHGLAVAWGMDVANYVAYRKGLFAERDFHRVHELLEKHFALTVKSGYSAEQVTTAMARDKKASGSSVTLILPRAFGDLQLVKTELDAALTSMVADYIDEYDIFS